jgi:hypothetical protein
MARCITRRRIGGTLTSNAPRRTKPKGRTGADTTGENLDEMNLEELRFAVVGTIPGRKEMEIYFSDEFADCLEVAGALAELCVREVKIVDRQEKPHNE